MAVSYSSLTYNSVYITASVSSTPSKTRYWKLTVNGRTYTTSNTSSSASFSVSGLSAETYYTASVNYGPDTSYQYSAGSTSFTTPESPGMDTSGYATNIADLSASIQIQDKRTHTSTRYWRLTLTDGSSFTTSTSATTSTTGYATFNLTGLSPNTRYTVSRVTYGTSSSSNTSYEARLSSTISFTTDARHGFNVTNAYSDSSDLTSTSARILISDNSSHSGTRYWRMNVVNQSNQTTTTYTTSTSSSATYAVFNLTGLSPNTSYRIGTEAVRYGTVNTSGSTDDNPGYNRYIAYLPSAIEFTTQASYSVSMSTSVGQVNMIKFDCSLSSVRTHDVQIRCYVTEDGTSDRRQLTKTIYAGSTAETFKFEGKPGKKYKLEAEDLYRGVTLGPFASKTLPSISWGISQSATSSTVTVKAKLDQTIPSDEFPITVNFYLDGARAVEKEMPKGSSEVTCEYSSNITPATIYQTKFIDEYGNEVIHPNKIRTKNNFSWDKPKVQGKEFNLTATEWNTFTSQLSAKEKYYYKLPEGGSYIDFDEAKKGNNFTATMAREAINSINRIEGSTVMSKTDIETGKPITAKFMNDLVMWLNN